MWSIGHFQEFNDWLDLMVLDCSSYLQLLSLVINPQEIVCASVTIVCVLKFFERFELILNSRDDVLIKSIWGYKEFFFTCEYVQWKSLKFYLPKVARKMLQKHTHTPSRLAQVSTSYLSTLLIVLLVRGSSPHHWIMQPSFHRLNQIAWIKWRPHRVFT